MHSDYMMSALSSSTFNETRIERQRPVHAKLRSRIPRGDATTLVQPSGVGTSQFLLPRIRGGSFIPDPNSYALASLWSDFIDWDKRRRGERGVIASVLRGHNCNLVLDAALGDGCDAIYLSRQGFNVSGNELDSIFRALATINITRASADIPVYGFYWSDLPHRFDTGSFDAIVCLGNSLTLSLSGAHRNATLRSFWHLLRSNGVLIIDERNYQYMLDFRRDVLNGHFEYKHQQVYCGTEVDATPIAINDRSIVMRYVHRQTHASGYLPLYPFQRGELTRELTTAGFVISDTFSDYSARRDYDADFYTHVAIKRQR